MAEQDPKPPSEQRPPAEELHWAVGYLREDQEAFRTEMRQEHQAFRAEMQSFRAEMRQEQKIFQSEMRKEFQTFRTEMRQEQKTFQSEMRKDFQVFRTEVRESLEAFRAEVQLQNRDIHARIDVLNAQMVTQLRWMIGGMIGMTGLLATLIKL